MSTVPPHLHNKVIPNRHTLPWSKYYWHRGQLRQRTVNARLRAYLAQAEHPATFHRITEGKNKGQFEMRKLNGNPHNLVLELALIYSVTTMKALEMAGVLDLWTQEMSPGGCRRPLVYGPKAG